MVVHQFVYCIHKIAYQRITAFFLTNILKEKKTCAMILTMADYEQLSLLRNKKIIHTCIFDAATFKNKKIEPTRKETVIPIICRLKTLYCYYVLLWHKNYHLQAKNGHLFTH